jgi:predicted GIY-YIG superfamily endonuclease
MERAFYVYILASRYRGTLYVGVTNNLSRRIGEHKAGFVQGSQRNTTFTVSSITKRIHPFSKPAHASMCSSAGGVSGSSR